MRAVLLCFAGTLAVAYLSRLEGGLWEDGYFVKRFAYNFWHHGSFSWNVVDGPIYGMTSQTLQFLGTALYALAPAHLVLGLKAALCVALFLALPVLLGVVRHPHALSLSERHPTLPFAERAAGLLPCAVGLASAPILEVIDMGLETLIGLLMVAVCLASIVKSNGTLRDRALIVASVLAVYLTRPDAVLIPLVLLMGHWVLALGKHRTASELRRDTEVKALTWTLLCIGLGLGALLVAFRLYYGTALPLPFYVKTHGISAQPADYIVYFAREKASNALQAVFFALPFVYLSLHERSRLVLLLLLSGALFGAYHYFATIETMGYFSRFYLPGLVPIFLAGGIAYRAYQLRRRWLVSALVYAIYVAACIGLKRFDSGAPAAALYVPAVLAAGVMLLGPAGYNPCNAVAIGLCLLVGAARNYPISTFGVLDDETIVLRQTRPRAVFRGLETLRAINPKVLYHTEMGAPGLLFPEARVVDLDGLLNEDITLHGARFEELCQADRPDAIFAPSLEYRQLRHDVLSSECIKGYEAMVPLTGKGALHVRKDLAARYSP